MHCRSIPSRLLFVFLSLVVVSPFFSTLHAQGVTTGSISGTVRANSSSGNTLGSTTVRAVQQGTGAVYGAITKPNGRYSIRGMRPGLYDISASFIGYESKKVTGVVVEVGEIGTLNFILKDKEGTLSKEVVVTAEGNPLFDKTRTGSGSTIDNATITSAPTINRSLSDMARLNPYTNQTQTAGSDGTQGVSIMGMNSRFNNFQIDGAVANDVFALGAAGTAGSLANANVLSLDAIERLRVNVSPYDVRQSGFTGGLVNVITRGGTNATHGSMFFYGRNQDLVGLSPDANRRPFDRFSDISFGGRIGGAILPSELFYHVTAEARLRSTPVDVGLNDPFALNNFPVAPSTLDKVIQVAHDRYGYDAGTYEPYVAQNNSYNVIARLDWSISETSKLQLRHNFTHAIQDRNVFRDATRFSLSSQANMFRSINNQTVVQLNSILGESLANELRVSFTSTIDERLLSTDPFPEVRIVVGANQNVSLGPERSSQANGLDQYLIALTDDITHVAGDHTLTFGTHNEFSRFNNLFIQDYYGSYQFSSVEAFADSTPNFYRVSYANPAVVGSDPTPRAAWSMLQLGVYAMDEWEVTPELRLTGGVRLDAPIFLTTPYENPVFAARFPGLSTSKVPSVGSSLLVAPRIGFNWDVSGDRTLVLRGGTGLFTGRIAAVWLSNQYSNTGMDIFRAQLGANNSQAVISDTLTGLPVQFDLTDPRAPRPGDSDYPGRRTNTALINITDENFRIPQVWRSTLGTDILITKGLTLTLEGMYGRFLNQVASSNINLKRSGMSVSPLDGRPLYAGESVDSLVAPEFTQVLVLKSRSEGYQYSASAQLNLEATNDYLPGIALALSYSMLRAEDLSSGQSATALSGWQNTDAIDPNNLTSARSNFDLPHRVTVNGSYTIQWTKGISTTLGLFYAGSSGRPFSMSYIQDYNGDNAVGGNDLIYVPKREDFNTRIVIVDPTGTDLRTSEQVWEQVMAFVEGNDVLKQYQGKILPRNAVREPWVNQLDFKVSQLLPSFVDNHNITVSLDVQNVLNLLNSDWGLQRYVNFQSYNAFGLVNDTETRKPFDKQGRLRMTYSEPVTNGRPGIYFTDNFYSRWRMQLGIRYSF
ncbi:MAG: carboxypeptidase regulatory-like domain-containing protein [bacterium]|nr:carboxypeptidase regulatory-like domain-containing protein [bacterium]